MNGVSITLPSTFHENFLALNEICWGLERFSLNGIAPEMRKNLLLTTTSVEFMEDEDFEHTSIQGELVVSFRDGEINVRQFINKTVVLTFRKESDRVKFDLCTNVFFKETFHPFTLDSTKDT